MFKKRLIILGVALFALISIVGIGFSSWYFANDKKADVNSNVLVTHASDFGEFKNVTSDPLVLQLDQPTASDANISVCTVATDNKTTTAATILSGVWEVSLEDFNDNTLTYSVVIYVKSDSLGNYVEVIDNNFVAATVDTTGDHAHTGYTAYKLDLTAYESEAANTNANRTGAYVDTTSVADKASVTLKLDVQNGNYFGWKADQAPTSMEAYKAMVAALKCTGVTTADDVNYGTTYITSGKELIVEFVVSRTTAE